MSVIRSLVHDCRGSFAISFALTAVPIIFACGIAVDYSTAYMKHIELQSAADAAVLNAASSGEADKEKLKLIARNNFTANVTTQFGATATVTAVEVSDDNHITLSATATLPLTLAKIVWSKGISVSVKAQALAGSDDDVEVAMVLDTTYSMSGQKLTDLKSAANSLLTVFEKVDKKKTMAKFSIVPFSQYVNVGMSNRKEAWLDVLDDYSTTVQQCTTSKPVISQDCQTVSKTCTNDGVSYACTQKVCTNIVYGQPVTTCAAKTNTYKWSGCVGSRTNPLDVNDIDPSKKYPGLLNTTCGSALTTLTNDYKVLRNAIKAMVANNETYVAPGVMWGWNTLSNSVPFAQGKAYGDNVKKFMIIMTDGDNTKSPSYPGHGNSDKTKANTLMAKVCENARLKDVTIYTVGVGISGAAAVELAKCASKPEMAITIQDSGTLVKVFEDIASKILIPRLTM
jgi:Flp pilus assembly protein TadG